MHRADGSGMQDASRLSSGNTSREKCGHRVEFAIHTNVSQGASNVRCSLCSTVTQVPSAASETAQLDCQGCHTRLIYARGASSVQCSVCHAVNIATQGESTKEPADVFCHDLKFHVNQLRFSQSTRFRIVYMRGVRYFADVRVQCSVRKMHRLQLRHFCYPNQKC